MTSLERLQKVIAQSGVTSRRKAEQMIVDGKVKVNNKVVTKLGTKVNKKDVVEVEDVLIEREAPVYYLFYKPREVITSLKDEKGRTVVTDYLQHVTERIFPIGRLDYQTSGILLLTNDGELANRLMHPKYEVEKVYVARIKGIPMKRELNRLKKGIKHEGELLKVQSYEVLSSDKSRDTTIIELTLKEGKNRHIRRLMENLGYPVLKLKREKYGFLTLQGLTPGEYRVLTPHEIKQLNLLTK